MFCGTGTRTKQFAKNNLISIGQNLRYIPGYRFLNIDMSHTLYEALPRYDFVQISWFSEVYLYQVDVWTLRPTPVLFSFGAFILLCFCPDGYHNFRVIIAVLWKLFPLILSCSFWGFALHCMLHWSCKKPITDKNLISSSVASILLINTQSYPKNSSAKWSNIQWNSMETIWILLHIMSSTRIFCWSKRIVLHFSYFAGFVQNLFLQAFTQYIFSFWTIFIRQQNQFISQY